MVRQQKNSAKARPKSTIASGEPAFTKSAPIERSLPLEAHSNLERELSEVAEDDYVEIAKLRQIIESVAERVEALGGQENKNDELIRGELWDRETRLEIGYRYLTGKKTRVWDNHLDEAWNQVLANRRREERAAEKKLSKDAPKLKGWKREIALVFLKHPTFSDLEICRLLDLRNEKKKTNIPLPAKLQKRQVTLWIEALTEERFNDLRPYVHGLLSKIAKLGHVARNDKSRSSPSNP